MTKIETEVVVRKRKSNPRVANKRRWDVVHIFECKEKRLFLKDLTTHKSLKILCDLYQFVYKTGNRGFYKELDSEKIRNLSKVHFMFMRVNL